MSKFTYILAVILFLSGCTIFESSGAHTTSTASLLEIRDDNYSIYYDKTSIDIAVESWEDVYRDPAFTSDNLLVYALIKSDNQEFENTVNRQLYQSQVSMVHEITVDVEQIIPQIRCHTDRYLSILTQFYYHYPNRIWHSAEGITIEITSGERVFLDDIIDVNDAFIAELKSCEGVLWINVGSNEVHEVLMEGFRKWLSEETSDEKLITMLDDCSKKIDEYIDDESIGKLLSKSTFFLESGKLIVILKEDPHNEYWMALDINQIEKYLKVSKW